MGSGSMSTADGSKRHIRTAHRGEYDGKQQRQRMLGREQYGRDCKSTVSYRVKQIITISTIVKLIWKQLFPKCLKEHF
jgi:hypothetical protein